MNRPTLYDGQEEPGVARVPDHRVGPIGDHRLVNAGLDGEGDVPPERSGSSRSAGRCRTRARRARSSRPQRRAGSQSSPPARIGSPPGRREGRSGHATGDHYLGSVVKALSQFHQGPDQRGAHQQPVSNGWDGVDRVHTPTPGGRSRRRWAHHPDARRAFGAKLCPAYPEPAAALGAYPEPGLTGRANRQTCV